MMTDFPFHYKGPVTLTYDGHSVDLHNVELWEEQECVQFSNDEFVPLGVYSWHGVARAVGVPHRLLGMLGGEVTLRLPDGRVGHAQVTGYCEDSIWIVEITGVGRPPNLNTI